MVKRLCRFAEALPRLRPPGLSKVSALPQRGPALALAAAAALIAGVTLATRPGPLGPAPAPTPSPPAGLALREAESLPGYLTYRGSAMGQGGEEAQVSARGGERPTPSPLPATPTATPEPKRILTYRVAAGDTVAALAERLGISVETILWANDLGNGAVLQPGQELTILPVSGVLHRVRPGDTLLAIAQAYKVEVAAIVEANALESADHLSIDQTLAIPGARPLPPPTAVPTRQPTPPPAGPAQPAAAAPANPEAAAKGAEIVAIATKFLGYAYVYGGASPATGFDCSGFTQYVYGQAGIGIGRTPAEQISAAPKVSRDALLPGDLVFFQNTYIAGLSHAGIYVGAGRFIHAASEARGVCYDSLDAAYWAARYCGASRPW